MNASPASPAGAPLSGRQHPCPRVECGTAKVLNSMLVGGRGVEPPRAYTGAPGGARQLHPAARAGRNGPDTGEVPAPTEAPVPSYWGHPSRAARTAAGLRSSGAAPRSAQPGAAGVAPGSRFFRAESAAARAAPEDRAGRRRSRPGRHAAPDPAPARSACRRNPGVDRDHVRATCRHACCTGTIARRFPALDKGRSSIRAAGCRLSSAEVVLRTVCARETTSAKGSTLRRAGECDQSTSDAVEESDRETL
jgi:hypothetical protein